MENFEEILGKATSEVTANYVKFPTLGALKGIYRERVYCYELYHQLRRLWPDECRYTLNGEVDKKAHLYFAENEKKPIPDFLIHVPGEEDNFAIIEVKSASADNKGIEKDIETLQEFTTRLDYQRGIYIVFGESNETRETASRVLERLEGQSIKGKVELWIHESGCPAHKVSS
ncbi:MAG: methionyl-tRNA formyltransferase-like protein [Alphaproteobacteria bacterium]|nr:methionyl-tRNA formyltransferase-like protein [Alphaproteobacteria bacterium]